MAIDKSYIVMYSMSIQPTKGKTVTEQEYYEPTFSGEMTCQQVMELALSVFPNAYIGEDNDGQWVIYTDIKIPDEAPVHGHFIVPE